MALADTTRAGVEKELREAIVTGRLVDWRTGDATADDPAHGAGWDAQRTVAADLLAELLTETGGPRRPRALRLAGARIVGRLNLEAAELVCPLLLKRCWFAEPVVLDEAQAPALRFPGCHVPGLHADQLSTRGNLELNDGFTATAKVSLDGAHIGGRLDLTKAALTDPDGPALSAGRLVVDQSMFCFDGFTASGGVHLGGAHIRGRLGFSGATLTNKNGPALYAEGFTVDRDMLCTKRFTANGAVYLFGAHVGGRLSFNNAKLINPGEDALDAGGLVVDGDMLLSGGFTATGQVYLTGAHIGGILSLADATLTNTSGVALEAIDLTVDGTILGDRGFKSNGAIDLHGARVGQSIDLTGAAITSPDGYALRATSLTVGQNMNFLEAQVQGVTLFGARIDGDLIFDGAALTNSKGPALNAIRLTVRAVLCRSGFRAQGEVTFAGAQVSGPIEFNRALLANPDPSGWTLMLQALQANVLVLRNFGSPLELLSLVAAKVGTLVDDAESWPRQVDLRGFSYDLLHEDYQTGARARLDWLSHQRGGYTPQPYEQLASFYRRVGRDDDARTVAIAKQRARRRTLSLPGKAWSGLLDILVGYGYHTWLAGVWLLGFVLGGWIIFDIAHPAYLTAPKPPGERPLFHAGLYALDLLLPIGDLNYQGAWIARGWARGFWLGWILAGWVLTTAVLAALAGTLKRE